MYFFIPAFFVGVKSRNSSKLAAQCANVLRARVRPLPAALPMPESAELEYPPVVLTFAASDPSGGAGMQADILTLASMGCHPLSVLTAITVQDTMGVEGILALDPEWVADQARCLLEDMPVDAFKIGVLGSIENIAAIAEILADYPDVPLVLDPVLASGRGDEFATEDMLHAIRELLLPQTTILTPNSIEARRLAEADDDDDATLETCAARLVEMGAEYVLITGTHEATPQVINTLYGKGGIVRTDSWQRLPGSYHGSGCTLASAIAAMLANGLELPEAVREAQDYTWHTLHKAYRPGMGQFLPDRLFWAREDDDAPAGEDDALRAADARGSH
jgi:hydroxymethylpyrimidine/phosphomethylpyrimidine kinase